jgi:hypothetical protein
MTVPADIARLAMSARRHSRRLLPRNPVSTVAGQDHLTRDRSHKQLEHQLLQSLSDLLSRLKLKIGRAYGP